MTRFLARTTLVLAISIQPAWSGESGGGAPYNLARQIAAAERGDANAQLSLGQAYSTGIGVAVDESRGFYWMNAAAEQGNVAALFGLGAMYLAGSGAPKDEKKAASLFVLAGERGNGATQVALGDMYAKGSRPFQRNDVEAVRWYRKAAVQGEAQGQLMLAVFLHEGRGLSAANDRESFQWAVKAAEQGDAGAQNFVGCLYSEGLGVEKNDALAVIWFRKAAESGFSASQKNLADMYFNGAGVKKDVVQAALWYRKAAEQGHAAAQNLLGVMYVDGQGVPQDHVEAMKLFVQARQNEKSDTKAADQNIRMQRLRFAQRSSPRTTNLYAAARRDSAVIRTIPAGDALYLLGPIDRATDMVEIYVKDADIGWVPAAALDQGAATIQPVNGFQPTATGAGGVLKYTDRCINGDCTRTFEDGHQVRFRAAYCYDALSQQWTWKPDGC